MSHNLPPFPPIKIAVTSYRFHAIRGNLSLPSQKCLDRSRERWETFLAREVFKRLADKFPRSKQDIGVVVEREKRQSTTVLLSWQRCNPRATHPLQPFHFHPFCSPSPPPPAPSLLLFIPLFPPFCAEGAWAVDNVIYTGRVINVLGDRRFKKTIGNRRQRRATVRLLVSRPPLA